MASLPALSDSTKRKLAVQWETLRDNQKLTEEDLLGYDRQRQRLLRMPANPPSYMRPLRPHEAARDVGLLPSVGAAKVRFRGIDSEYWPGWCSSGCEYEVYRDWLNSITQQVLAELASLWKGKSDPADRWFQGTCAPAIEKALAKLVKQRIKQAREVEVERLDRKARAEARARATDGGSAKASQTDETEPCGDESTRTEAEPAVSGASGNRKNLSATSWDVIEILFLSDHRVQIRNGTTTETRNYTELGFADLRTGTPNRAWDTLRALAEARGIIRDGSMTGEDWPKVEKRIQEIRKVFRKHFTIAADPVPFVRGTGYQACFKIGCSPSFPT